MNTHIRNAMLWAIGVGLLSPSVSMAGSIRTFHQSWLHGGSYSVRSYKDVDNYACGGVNKREPQSSKVVHAPVNSSSGERSAKSTTRHNDKTDRTADKSANSAERR